MTFHRRLLTIFLAADFAFLVIHVAFGVLVLKGAVASWPDVFNIAREWGGGEVLNYIKWVLIVGALLALFFIKRHPVFLGLAGFFFVCLLDDSLSLHERGAYWLIQNLDTYRYFGSQQAIAGELIIWALLAVPAIASLGTGWVTTPAQERRKMIPALVLFGGILFCAIGLDVLHTSLDDRSLEAGLVGILEDGGEMVFLTLLLAFICEKFAEARELRQGIQT